MFFWLPVLFFVVAAVYSMAGFGGGSSYIAILLVSGFPNPHIPALALVCNLIVSSQGSLILIRRGQLFVRPVLPLLGGSMPAAFIAGAWQIREGSYLVILALSLTIAGMALLLSPREHLDGFRRIPPLLHFTLGAVLGTIAGLSGIGGGIFLAPVLHLLKAENTRQIAGTAALFIALNSLMGLLGQLTKLSFEEDNSLWIAYAILPLAVVLGGQLGSRLLSNRLNPHRIRNLTGFLVLMVAIRLWINLLSE